MKKKLVGPVPKDGEFSIGVITMSKMDYVCGGGEAMGGRSERAFTLGQMISFCEGWKEARRHHTTGLRSPPSLPMSEMQKSNRVVWGWGGCCAAHGSPALS